MLFMCPACDSHLELKGKEEFRRHVNHCEGAGANFENQSRDEQQSKSDLAMSVPSFKCKRCECKFWSLSEFDQHVIRSGDPTTCEVVRVVGDGEDDVKFSQGGNSIGEILACKTILVLP